MAAACQLSCFCMQARRRGPTAMVATQPWVALTVTGFAQFLRWPLGVSVLGFCGMIFLYSLIMWVEHMYQGACCILMHAVTSHLFVFATLLV